MLWLLLTYLIFQVGYDHWSYDTVTSKAIYFAFQYGWVAAVALWHGHRTGTNQRLYFIIALIMFLLSINELTWINTNANAYAMMTNGGPPAFGLSILALVLFLWYVLSKKLSWESSKRTGS